MKLFDVYPLFDIEPIQAQGSWIWDKSGTPYLDLYGGHAVISIGHNHPHFVDRLKKQLDQISFYSNSVKNSLQEELADKLGKLSGYSDYQLFLCNSGAEANENALKLASFVTGKKKIVAFTKAFHGRTSGAVATTDNPKIVAPFNAQHAVEFLPFNNVQALKSFDDRNVAAIIVEGIQGVGGIQVPSKEFVEELARKAKSWQALLILDEVQSGYGRTGKFFAHQYFGVEPDLITIAKGMGNGFPVGGVMIHPNIKPWSGMLGTTFGGNYLACAAALSVLDVIESENLMTNALTKGQYWKSELQKMEPLQNVRGEGLMIGFDLPDHLKNLRSDLLFKHHIFTGEAKPNTVRLLPSLALEQKDADIFLEAMHAQLKLVATS